MKQKLLNSFTWRASLLVAFLCCAFSSAWGQTYTFYTLNGTADSNSNDSYTTESTITQDGISWKVMGNTIVSPWKIGFSAKKNAGARSVYSTSSVNETVADVKLYIGDVSGQISVSDLKLVVASDASFTENVEEVAATFSANSTITFSAPQTSAWTNKFYKFSCKVSLSGNGNGSGYFEFEKADFNVEKNDPVFNITSASILFGNTKQLSSGTSETVDVKTDGTVTLVSGNTNIATVNGLVISTVSAGVTNLTITAAEGTYYKAGTATIPLTVTAPEGQSVAGTVPTVTLNAYGYATFCSQYPLDFSNATDYSAWIVTGVDNRTDVLIQQVTGDVKGGTGLLLKGEPRATITLTSADSETVPSGNKLVGLLAPTYIEDGTYYGLSGKDFLKIESSADADRIAPAGKAILPADAVTADVKTLNLVFTDGTGIREIQSVSAEEAAEIFNLAGQRLQKAQRGVNIVNGKKVLVK